MAAPVTSVTLTTPAPLVPSVTSTPSTPLITSVTGIDSKSKIIEYKFNNPPFRIGSGLTVILAGRGRGKSTFIRQIWETNYMNPGLSQTPFIHIPDTCHPTLNLKQCMSVGSAVFDIVVEFNRIDDLDLGLISTADTFIVCPLEYSLKMNASVDLSTKDVATLKKINTERFGGLLESKTLSDHSDLLISHRKFTKQDDVYSYRFAGDVVKSSMTALSVKDVVILRWKYNSISEGTVEIYKGRTIYKVI